MTPTPIGCILGSIVRCRAAYDLWVCLTPKDFLSEMLPICSSPITSATSNPICSGSMNTTTPRKPTRVDLRDKRYRQHRCYKLVSLTHVNRKQDFFFVVAARVVPGRRHECPILYELVEEVG